MGSHDEAANPDKGLSKKNKSYLSWMRKLGSAIVDQALFAGSNFIINILLARWLPNESYGAFAVAFAWFLLPQNLYEAIILEPLAIFGSGKYLHKLRNYLGFVYYGHLIITLVFALIIALGALAAHFFDSTLVSTAMLGAAIAAPMILLRWLTRQPFYIQSRPHWAAIGGFIYFCLVIPSLFLLKEFDSLSPFSALVMMGIATLISSIILTSFVIKPNWSLKDDELTVRSIVADHISYGKWSTATRILMWFPSNVYTVVLPVVAGLAASATFKALTTLLTPLLMAMVAFMSVLLPIFVRSYRADGQGGLNQRFYQSIYMALAVSLSYLLILIFFGKAIIHFLFDGQFDDAVSMPILITMGLTLTVSSLNIVTEAALRARGGVKQTFQSRVVPAILALTVGIGLLSVFGVLGALLAQLMTGTVSQISMMRFYMIKEK